MAEPLARPRIHAHYDGHSDELKMETIHKTCTKAVAAATEDATKSALDVPLSAESPPHVLS